MADQELSADSKTVLLVEDDEVIRELIHYLLTREGYNSIVALDGLQAHEMIDQNEAPDLILLDVMLPYIDGYELIQHVRKKDSWSDVPIIMLTSITKEQDIVKALDTGANDYVTKPFQPLELIARIRRLIK